jgi:carbamoyltransferase
VTAILGISAFYHDSAAALVVDGDIVAAAQEERFTRKKQDSGFPTKAIDYCLKEANLSAKDLTHVAFYDKPWIKFERIMNNALWSTPRGLKSFFMALPMWLKQKLWLRNLIYEELPGYDEKILFFEHHESHAASAFYPSPFESAAILTIDGVGEWSTTSQGVGKDNKIEIQREIHYPHSLGLLYSAFTYYCGFKVNSGEYKLMGLSPYGNPTYVDKIRDNLLDVKDDGSFKLNMDYFGFPWELRMTNDKFHELFGGPPRKADVDKMEQRHMDLAHSIQVVLEDIVLAMAKDLHAKTGEKYLCMAGGCALNCVANGRVLREGPFEDIWIQPAAGDAGGALGAALDTWYRYLGNEREKPNGRDFQKASYLGPEFSDTELKAFIDKHELPFHEVGYEKVSEKAAELIVDQKVLGWFQGRMEFGPRALGSRSIMGDARSPSMQSTMNLKIKYRESFRPFAPVVMADKAHEWFDCDRESPYMLLVAQVKEEKCRQMTDEEREKFGLDKLKVLRGEIPAVTHVDYSARLQTVNRDDNKYYYDVLHHLNEKTGCPVAINTSFNVRGEPIVCTPMDAYRCFMRTEMDALIMGPYLFLKEEQPKDGRIDYSQEFEAD